MTPEGKPVFEIGSLQSSRARWMPSGRSIAFRDRDSDTPGSRWGVYVQDFEPGRDTNASRRRLAGFDPALETESFGISPDGLRIALADIEWSATLLLAEGVPDIAPVRPPPR